jgi:hypothetical protein
MTMISLLSTVTVAANDQRTITAAEDDQKRSRPPRTIRKRSRRRRTIRNDHGRRRLGDLEPYSALMLWDSTLFTHVRKCAR